MKVTKHEHACLVLEKGGSAIVIDPGSFTLPLPPTDPIAAVVITHEHPDHWTPEHLNRIREAFPDVRFIGPAGVVAAARAEGFEVESVADGDELTIGEFALSFHGSQHAVIHSSVPVIDNVGVFVDDDLYYAGDSFTVPPKPVGTLAVPAGAPWLKIGEAMDYVIAVAPRRAFGVHEMVLSTIGKNFAHPRLTWATEQGGGEYVALEPGQSLDL